MSYIICQHLNFALEFDKARAGSSKSTPKAAMKHKIFAPASPAFSGKTVVSSTMRRTSLRALDTGMEIV